MMGFISHPLVKPDSIESRVYQEVLTHSVVEKGNTLIVAPTALGKTVIAALVAAHVLEKKPGSKVIFMAPTKPLAVQHHNSLRSFLSLDADEFAIFTGAVRPSERKEVWDKARVISATPQCIENDLLTDAISLDNVGLLIVDEAHRAVKGYSYVFIADRYAKRVKNPLILALTASPGSSREKIQEVCDNLFIKNVEIKTENDPDVKPYVNKKTVTWKKVRLPQEFLEVKKLLESFMADQLKELKALRFIESYRTNTLARKEIIQLQRKLLEMRAVDPNAFQGLSITASLMKAHHALELLETQGISPLLEFFAKLQKEKTKASKVMTSDLRVQKALVILEQLNSDGKEHPKIKLLLDTVEEELHDSDNVLVFSNYRGTADRLTWLLRERGINCEKFIGQATKGNDKGLTQKQQSDLIQRFKDGEFRVMVATCVAEEGIDIPSVDSVVFYEPAPSEIRLIQRRGRTGRKHAGKIVVLMAEGTRDETYYWMSVRKEKKMHGVLKGLKDVKIESQKTLGQFSPSEDKEETGKPVIFVDMRERASGIVRELVDLGVQVKTKQLEVADFLVSDRIAVERKQANDFIESMITGRLFKQAGELAGNFEKPVIIVEGGLYGIRNIHDNAIRGALASLVINFGIPIIQTRDVHDSAALLALLAKREQSEESRPVRLRGEKRSMTVPDQQQFVVESLPQIGPLTAKELLKHFRSVEGVFTAQEEQLKEVEGVGDKRAKEMRKLITQEYDKE